jgi:small subunit ribosomal protein S5
MNQISKFHRQAQSEVKEYEEKVIQINRVSKKTRGGNKIGFSALVVVGDKKGRVGVALGKAPDTLAAIKKGTRKAKKKLIKIPLNKTTIPFPMRVKRGAAEVILKPAPEGTGVIAGGAVRAVVEAAGIRDIVAKILGSSNKASNVHATLKALQKIQNLVRKKETIIINQSNYQSKSAKNKKLKNQQKIERRNNHSI